MPVSNFPGIRIKLLTTCLLIFLFAWTTPSHSQDCLASTKARALMSKYPALQNEKLLTDTGSYSAVLKNNDIVIAKFAKCELGMSAHYFSANELSDNERIKRVKMFLSYVLASKPIVKKALTQLDGMSSHRLNLALVLDGYGDQHQVVIKKSASPIYKLHIQYDWIPPEF